MAYVYFQIHRDSMTSAERATHDRAVAASLASVAAPSYPPVPLPLGWTEHVSKTTGMYSNKQNPVVGCMVKVAGMVYTHYQSQYS